MDNDAGLSAPQGEDAWFAPKRYGYGAGLPISGKGWRALGLYVAGMILLATASGPLAQIHAGLLAVPFIAMALATIWFVRVCQRHTKGGWRWRWGEDA